MLLFGAIACQIEEKYGAPRIILLFFISALGGTFENGLIILLVRLGRTGEELHCLHNRKFGLFRMQQADHSALRSLKEPEGQVEALSYIACTGTLQAR